jgi:NAD-dependent SIR2 family protein deacetylase
MTIKVVNGECSSCESTYSVEYSEELVAQEYPEHCPFCGDQIQELSEEHQEDEDEDDFEEEWN